jgi:hypothetical protein
MCIEEAAANGISIDDMEPEWSSVETIIYETMQNDMDAELDSNYFGGNNVRTHYQEATVWFSE